MKPSKLNSKIIITLAVIIITGLTISGIYSQEPSDAKDTSGKTSEENKEGEKPWETETMGWKIDDFQPYVQAMKEIGKLSVEYSEIILKVAIDEYSTGIDILADMETEILKVMEANKNKRNLNEKWYWQEIDRKNQEKRQLRMMKQEAKMKAVTSFVMAINHLDEVHSRSVIEKREFLNFKKRLFQVFVSTQYDLQNFLPCIPILERYILIDDTTRNDIWAYKYLTNCYAFMESVLKKYKHASEETIMHYRQKKNRTLLVASELQYGVDSVEYKHLQELVEGDEKRTERLNDFK